MVDLSKANLLSGYNLHRFHEQFNRIIKTNVIAQTLCKLQLDEGLTTAKIKEKLYETGELWGGMPDWRRPENLLIEAKHDLGNQGVIRVFSAFDLFLDTLDAEINSVASHLGKKKSKSTVTEPERSPQVEESDRLSKFLDRHKWVLKDGQSLSIVFDYYRISRNCIAHRNHIASPALELWSNDTALKAAISLWRKMTKNLTAPPVAKITAGDPIQFTHRDALFASSVTRLIALQMNYFALNDIGLEGLILLISKQLIKETDPLKLKNMRTTHSYFKDTLNRYHRIPFVSQGQVRTALNHLGMWETCDKHFKKLKSYT